MNEEIKINKDTRNDDAETDEAPVDVRIAQLAAEANEAKDRALRAQAELDNVRKRLRKEMDDERRYALMPLVTDLLPVVDNIGRALTAAEKSADASSLLTGVKLVAQQLEAILARHHTVKIEAQGKPFDPNVHAAIMQQPTDEYPPNTVVMVAQEGYQLHDRVVRPSQVIVSSSPPNA
ncbi:MAG: nucleotide exchange factor GrpE [Planctomycetia bacterium]|nr:nucleotide exchange factor GrpE [Planctomycetia bacterium]